MTSSDAYKILNLLPGVGPVRVKQLLSYYKSPEKILREKKTSLAKIQGIGGKIAELIANWQTHVDLARELEQVKRAGAHLVACDEPGYPPLLKEIYDPPLCLYVRGDVDALRSMQTLAIVGSRRNTNYGAGMTEKLVMAAVNSGWTIISGLARGIDTVGHQVTLDSMGVTIAVLAGGLGHIYPPENVRLAREICKSGALISEQPIQSKPDRRAFPMRNRIISGISQGTVVIEARERSGALITAQQALDQGRQVFAVPGRADAPQSKGCHGLIKQGAKLVEGIEDIHEEFSLLPNLSHLAAREDVHVDENPRTSGTFTMQFTELEQEVMNILREGELQINDIGKRFSYPIHILLSTLMNLEMKKVVRQLPGKRFERIVR